MSDKVDNIDEVNAFLDCREQQNEREEQHHDESTSTFRISKRTYKVAVAILIAVVTIAASSASGVVRFYQTEDNGRLDRRTVAKLFYQAVAIDKSGGSMDDINYALNKMYDFEYDRLLQLHDPKFLEEAEKMKSYRVIEGIKKRDELFKDRESFEAIRRLSKAVEKNPAAWEDFINNHK